jgi:hypothetical protein
MTASLRRASPAAVVIAGFLAFAFGVNRTDDASAQTEPRESEPGEGVVCAWAIYSAMAEVGGRCLPEEDLEFQEELQRSVARIDEYVLLNASPPVTVEQVAEFKREQGNTDSTTEHLCGAEMIGYFRSFAEQGADSVRTATDQMLARPGNPTWGTCL